MEKKVMIILLLLMVPLVMAAPSGLSVSPNPLWLDTGHTLTATFTCGANESAGHVKFMNAHYIFQCSSPTLSAGVYSSVCDLSNYEGESIYGNYQVYAECAGNETTNATVSGLINRLAIEALTVKTTNIYSGDDIELSFKLKKNDQYVCSDVTVDAYLDGSISVGKNLNPLCDISTNTMKLTLHTAPLGDLSEGWYDLKIVAKYTESGTHVVSQTQQAAVYIKPTYQISMLSQGPFYIVGGNEITLPVSVKKKGEPLKDLENQNFRLRIYRGSSLYKSVEPSSVDTTQDGYSLKFYIPDMPSGKYKAHINLMVGGIQKASTQDFILESRMPLEVSFVDSHGRAYDGTLSLVSDSFAKSYRSGSDGLIEDSVLAGNYTAVVDVGGMKVTLHGLSISDGLQNPFRMDFLSSGFNLPGISAANIYVFEVAVPFTTADVQLKYDDTKVYDEQRLEVYACHNWNYGRRQCSGQWEEVPGVVKDTVRNVVRFNTTRFSAFVIGERKQLFFSAELPKKSYYKGENIKITGKVVDSDNNPVEGVSIRYTFEGQNQTGTGSTDAAGYFNILASAPEMDGNVKLSLRAEKPPYIPAKMSTVLEIYSKPDVNVIAPQSINAKIGERENFTIEIMNTGQVNLSNVRISVTGIDPKWFDYFPQFMDIDVGQKKTVTFAINIPKEDCAQQECKDFYFVKIKAWNEKASDEETTTLKLVIPSTPSKKSGVGDAISSITGKLVALPADQWALSVVVLGIFSSFMLFGKKMKNNISRSFSNLAKPKPAQESRMERINRIKTTLKVEPEHYSRIRARPFRFRFKDRK